MIKITKPLLQKALIAGFFSAFTIGVLTVLTYKSTLGYFIAASFGSSMVLLFGFPESPFAQPKNVFFGHLVTALVGVIFVNYIPLPIYISIAIAVGAGVFLMILFNIVHPPAGGNPIIVIIGSASYDYLINPIIFGCIIILLLAIVINKYLLIINNCLTNFVVGVLTNLMLLSNVKIINKLSNFKTIFIKAGIIASLIAYWGVILVGTFITFN